MQQHTADSVDLRGCDTTGAATIVTLLNDDGLTLVAEQVVTDLPDPDDQAAERDLQSRVESVLRRQEPAYDDVAGTRIGNRE